MVSIELIKVEERRDNWLLYSVLVDAITGRAEFSIAVKDHGTSASNEATVLRSILSFVGELAVSARLRLGAI